MPANRRTPVQVPTLPIEAVGRLLPASSAVGVDFHVIDQRVPVASTAFMEPYRTNYYGVGICLAGSARVGADLEELVLKRNCVLAMPPQTIKQWRFMSEDLRHIAVFFTQRFLAERTDATTARFEFFASGRHLVALSPDAAKPVEELLRQIKRLHSRGHPHRDRMLRALLNVLLLEIEPSAPLPARPVTPLGRGEQLTAAFKKLVALHFAKRRQVAWYAHALSVTARHLSATVHDHSGRTASEWIKEALALEGRVLLRDARLTIAQVAESLHFPDASSFGRFFKNATGRSPLAYRKESLPGPTF